MQSQPEELPRSRPQSLTDLFMSLTAIALQGFGGVVAIAQRELVDHKRWLTNEEFVEEWAVAQIMPGPNIVNLCIMLGSRYFGVRGALVAIAGLLAVPLILLLIIAALYAQVASHPQVTNALRGMGAVAAGLIAAVGLKLLPSARKNILGPVLSIVFGVLGFVGVAILRWPLAYVLIGLGSLACVCAYRKLAP